VTHPFWSVRIGTPAAAIEVAIVHAGDRLRGDHPAVVGNRGLFFCDGDPPASRPTTANLLAQREAAAADTAPVVSGDVTCIHQVGAKSTTEVGDLDFVPYGARLSATHPAVRRYPDHFTAT
jgi:hypothetical protein